MKNLNLVFFLALASLLSCNKERAAASDNNYQDADVRQTSQSQNPVPQPVATNVATSPARVKSTVPSPSLSCTDDVVGIVGGVPVKESTLIIRSTVKLWNVNTSCTATLIGPRHFVTAAHCLVDPADTPVDIRYGTTATDPEKRIPIDNWVKHPLRISGPSFDIGVFTLKSDVPAELVPVVLASPSEIVPGLELIIAGYGRLGETVTTARPMNMVKAVITTVNKTDRHFSTVIDGTGSCYGDSGGPGYIVDKGTKCLKAMGVVSKASIYGNGLCGQGDTMADMTRYQGWIAASFKQLGAPLPGLINDGSEVDAAKNVPGR